MYEVPDLLEPALEESDYFSSWVIIEILSYLVPGTGKIFVQRFSIKVSCLMEFMKLKLTVGKFAIPTWGWSKFLSHAEELLVLQRSDA